MTVTNRQNKTIKHQGWHRLQTTYVKRLLYNVTFKNRKEVYWGDKLIEER